MSNRTLIPALALALVLPIIALAQAARPSDAILDALHLGDLLSLMRDEAEKSADDLARSMLDGRTGTSWDAEIARINDPERLEETLRGRFDDALPAEHRDPILRFMSSDQAQRIIALELSARQAMIDDEIDAMSRAALAEARDQQAARLDLLDRFIEINDLIEGNVASALQANLAFMEGLAGAVPGARPPGGSGSAIEDVMAQEPQIRAETREWIYAFLLLAYQPLSDNDLQAYIAFSESDAGQAFNEALFSAFDAMFMETSRLTGAAVGRELASEEI